MDLHCDFTGEYIIRKPTLATHMLLHMGVIISNVFGLVMSYFYWHLLFDPSNHYIGAPANAQAVATYTTTLQRHGVFLVKLQFDLQLSEFR